MSVRRQKRLSFESRDRAVVIGEVKRLLDTIGRFRFAPLGDESP